MPIRNDNRQQTVGWTPAVFQGEEWSPTPFDYSVMERSLARQEERKKEATQQMSAVKSALGQAREKLHRDDATLQWFDEKANQIEQNLKDYASVGDYAGAINMAIEEAGNLANDAELAGHIRNNAEYQQKMQELDNMVKNNVISNATANWIRKENPYSIDFKKDGDGNVIGTEEWKFKENPVADLDVNALFAAAFKAINPDQTSGSVQSNVIDGKGNLVTKGTGGMASDRTQRSSSKIIKVEPKDILKQVSSMLMANPDWMQQLRQHYNGAFQAFKDNEEKLASMSKDDPDYNTYAYLVNKQKELFYTNGQENAQTSNTFANYFNKTLFESDQAKAYGYSITDYDNMLNESQRVTSDGNNDVDPPVLIALSQKQNAVRLLDAATGGNFLYNPL